MMLTGHHVLICEDEPYIAIHLAMAVEDAGGTVLGPAGSIEEADVLLNSSLISAAILDVNLADGDVTPVAEALLTRGIPVIIQTGRSLPAELKARHPDVPTMSKPVAPERIVEHLARLLGRKVLSSPS
jgi:DNA-binding NtrC family response regulator